MDSYLGRCRVLDSKGRLPLLVGPIRSGTSIASLTPADCQQLDGWLLAHGAVLLRGFDCDEARFPRYIGAQWGEPLDYHYRSTPRKARGGGVFTATEYPPNRIIPLHCENAYSENWPTRIAFHCVQPAQQGGETPIADVLRVGERIGPVLFARFRERGVRYVRHFHPGVDLPWSEVFQTAERAQVEHYCRAHGIEWQWIGASGLRTSQVCQGTAVHPQLGHEVWFNQAHLFHVSSLGQDESTVFSLFADRGLPRNACYGDGEEIDRADMQAINEAFRAEAVTFVWQSGDVLLLDNMQVAHGRNTFRGPRLVLVCMARAYSVETKLAPALRSSSEHNNSSAF